MTKAEIVREKQLEDVLWWILAKLEIDHSRESEYGIEQCSCEAAKYYRSAKTLLYANMTPKKKKKTRRTK